MTHAIHDRYRIVRRIGRGAQGSTYLAADEESGGQVALKELDFAGIGSWDTVHVFERESAVLGGLTHSNIPRIVESFRVEDDDGLRMFLAQEFVEGRDLQLRLQDGELFDERRLRSIAAAVLEIVAYLHGHSPPVLHRDIKPANLIERPDGTIALVDFGAAQGASRGTSVIGTTGYMPAEQLMGHAGPTSDLYALGATLIHLATRKHPSDLGSGLGLDWRRYANLSEKFCAWLDRLVAPMPEDRFPSAIAAARALDDTTLARLPPVDETDDILDLIERRDRPPPVELAGHYAIQRRGPRLSVKCHPQRITGLQSQIIAAIAIGIGLVGYQLIGWLALIAPALLIGGALLAVRGSRMEMLEGHDRGIDIVWARNELIERVALSDIAGPDIVEDRSGRQLVLWKRDGGKVLLDTAPVGTQALESLRGEIQRWLGATRELE